MHDQDGSVCTYQGDSREDVYVKGGSPFLGLRVTDLLDRLEHAVVHNKTIKALPGLCSEIGSLFADGKVRKVS